jgi:hypothetical protein
MIMKISARIVVYPACGFFPEWVGVVCYVLQCLGVHYPREYKISAKKAAVSFHPAINPLSAFGGHLVEAVIIRSKTKRNSPFQR